MTISQPETRTSILPQIQITPGIAPSAPAAPQAPAAPRSTGFLSRQHILEATEECFADGGYDGTTIRAIAARLGCSVGSIYRYFTDKRELLLAVAASAMQPVIDGLNSGDTLVASQRRYLEQATTHAELYRLMFWLAWTPGVNAALPEPVAEIITGWARLLGEVDRARQAWAILHGTLMLGEKAATLPTPAPPLSASSAPPIETTLPISAGPRFVTTAPLATPHKPAHAPLPVIEIISSTPTEDFTLL